VVAAGTPDSTQAELRGSMNGTHRAVAAVKLKPVDGGGNCGARVLQTRRHGPDDSSLANDVGRRLTADFYGKREVHFHRRIGFEQTVHPKEHAGTADVFRVSLAPLALSDRAITYRHVHRKSRGSLHFSLFLGRSLSLTCTAERPTLHTRCTKPSSPFRPPAPESPSHVEFLRKPLPIPGKIFSNASTKHWLVNHKERARSEFRL